ncbi:MAG TPA: AI-2E family transporter [Solirubrobacteraceae bacterium]|nr:AI-2E family transporter [Solirubrobacteraceae bacterium]
MSDSTETDETDVTDVDASEELAEASQQVIDEIRAEALAEAGADAENEYGQIGKPFDRRSPFYVGFVAALGVAVAFALAYIVVAAGQILVLLGLAFFLAVGLDPAVLWIYRHGLPRWLSVTIVLITVLAMFAGFLIVAVPVIVTQAGHLADNLPHYLQVLKNRHTELGKLNTRYHIVKSIQKLLHGSASVSTAVGVGKVVLDLVASVAVVVIVTVYLLADMPRVRRGIYQLAPKSRRARTILLTDEILNRVGGYVLGNLLTSLIAGIGTYFWALAFGIPYALLLGILVAVLDLIPIVGSTIGGIIVSLVALTVSLPVAIATAIFYVVYRFLEDYLLTPRIMARTVAVPGIVTVVATVIGGAILGIIGALVAIPIAAGLKLLLEEVAAPRLDES